jgi:hypothetical protein
MNEKLRRLWAASEVMSAGYGAVAALSRATCISRKTIRAGVLELSSPAVQSVDPSRLRQPGAGRKSLVEHTPKLIQALDKLMEPYTCGDPMRL